MAAGDQTTPATVSQRFLLAFVFTTGAGIMGIEMAASRLLAPFFGTSLLVWANLIGLIMIALTIGYFFGGRLADKHPDPSRLYRLAVIAGVLTSLIPLWTRPVFAGLQTSIIDASASVIIGSFFAAALAFVPPVILLGAVSPFAYRLATRDVASAGKAAGRLSAASTVGSLIGIYLASFVAIPLLGTKETVLLLSTALIVVGAWGTWAAAAPHSRRPIARLAWLLALVAIPALIYAMTAGAVRPQPGLVYERESLYQFIQVLQAGDVTTVTVNEGGGTQSVYQRGALLQGWYSDYVQLLPYLLPARSGDTADPDPLRLLLIGVAGGTIARQFADMHQAVGGPQVAIDGVEIDPAMIEVARRYFGVQPAHANLIAADGRVYLASTENLYDFIMVDAYSREVYIPFQLATVEFFTLARRRLTENGILVLNVNATRPDAPILQSMLATVHAVFPCVYFAHVGGEFNRLVLASAHPLDFGRLYAEGLPLPLQPVAHHLGAQVQAYEPKPALVLTDNRAPTEFLTDLMIIEYGTRAAP